MTDYLPISKLNTVVFCPRRYFIEAILQDNKTNHHMIEGSGLHERTVRDGEGLTVWSDRLGIIGRVDQVKQEGEAWLITEFKKGGLGEHESDQVQLCALAMCFEEMNDKRLEHGFIFYNKTKQRLEVNFDEALRDNVEAAVTTMRELANADKFPPVTTNRNKCRGCSVKEICQPDLKVSKWAVNFGEVSGET
jgi:CRISPR-associated exonuclease Cas4